MEERLVDKEDERLIRIKKKAEGVDAEDALAEEGEESEEEVLVTLPEDDEEYDEDLVGLTPSELNRELARRKKLEEEARAEYDKLVKEAGEALQRGDYDRAATLYAQAVCYPFADQDTVEGLWSARTKNFADTSPFYVSEYAEEFSEYDDESKKRVRERIGDTLKQEQAELAKEEAELAPTVLEKQETRRQAFLDNRKYYSVRLMVFISLLMAFAVATIVSASYIVRTRSNLPLILTGVFGGLALIAFILSTVFLVKFSGANKLCRINDKLSSTEEGKALVQLRQKLECLKLILED